MQAFFILQALGNAGCRMQPTGHIVCLGCSAAAEECVLRLQTATCCGDLGAEAETCPLLLSHLLSLKSEANLGIFGPGITHQLEKQVMQCHKNCTLEEPSSGNARHGLHQTSVGHVAPARLALKWRHT